MKDLKVGQAVKILAGPLKGKGGYVNSVSAEDNCVVLWMLLQVKESYSTSTHMALTQAIHTDHIALG